MITISDISADGWLNFIGTMIGAFITALSIIAAIRINSAQLRKQDRMAAEAVYKKMRASIPAVEEIFTQSDIFDKDDRLNGAFCSPETKMQMLNARMKNENNSDPKKINEQVKKLKEYEEYWQKYFKSIEEVSNDLIVESHVCARKVLMLYMDFIVAFQNEHGYSGPIIDSELLRRKRERLENAIITA